MGIFNVINGLFVWGKDKVTPIIATDVINDRVGLGTTEPIGKLHISTTEGDGVVIDALNDGGLHDKNKTHRSIKQGEVQTNGTGTATIVTIPMDRIGEALTLTGVITANNVGSVSIGGTFMALTQRVGGSATIIGTVDSTIKHNSIGSPTFTVLTSGANIIISVTGGGDTFPTNWLVTYEYQIATAPLF